MIDDLSSHLSKIAQEIVKSKGDDYVLLPSYSPNPDSIEKMWSKVEQIIRDLKPRIHEELYEATVKALSMVTHDDAHGWFKSCGYLQNKN